MSGLHSEVDPDGLLEYSVVFNDRSLNHMSRRFQRVMNDISTTLKSVYEAAAVAVVPGGGTFGMEAVARQFAAERECLVVRNGWFSYRWSQILDTGRIAKNTVVLKARRVRDGAQAPFLPPPIEEVTERIRAHRPAVVFAPHVETSAGMLLPDEYLAELASAARAADSLFVLDCVASGALWVDMGALGVDVLISAPQKGWTASPCAALVLLGQRALEQLRQTRSSSFACDLRQWLDIMRAYENGGHAYHATLPTDALTSFCDAMNETVNYGLAKARARQIELGRRVRELLESHGYPSVAAAGFQAPPVVVSYTDQADIQAGRKFLEQGIQVAAGVPLKCGEPEDFRSFRIGLFGLDKLQDIEGTVTPLRVALENI